MELVQQIGTRSILIQTTAVHDQVADNLVEVIALILLPLAVLMCAYALTVFVWRSRAIAKKTVRYPTPGRNVLALGHREWLSQQ